ncbi:ATP-binding protein [Marinobacter sp. 1Y8]
MQLTTETELPNAMNWLDRHLTDRAAAVQSDLKVVLDEQLANIFNYGVIDGQPVEVRLELDIQQDTLQLRVIDNGVAFNPLEDEIDTDFGDIEDRPIGGLGLLLMRELTDVQHYQRQDNLNILELTRYLPQTS